MDNLQKLIKKSQKTKFIITLQAAKGDIELSKLLQQDHTLKKAIYHNVFGCKCMDANIYDKAQKHLKLAVQSHIPLNFSNANINLANFYSQIKQLQQAARYYYQAIKLSCHNPKYILQMAPPGYREAVFSNKLNSYQAYADAHINLSVIEVNRGNQQAAYELISKAIQLNPTDSVALINLGDILRQIGKQKQAISLSWQLINKQILKNQGQVQVIPQFLKPKPIKINSKIIDVLTVKWGTRYPAYYTNRLYKGIKRFYSGQFNFICFTDDKKDLLPQIKALPLIQNWQGWWGKATLFGYQSQNKKIYIDLDTIIVGDLTPIFNFQGCFGILGSGMFECQKKHDQGVNSSIMIWSGKDLQPIYSRLKQNFNQVCKFIRRFDFWIEMNIQKFQRLQCQYKGYIVDFLKDCQKQIPKGASIVNFPRKPKPQDYPAEWIIQYWNDEI